MTLTEVFDRDGYEYWREVFAVRCDPRRIMPAETSSAVKDEIRTALSARRVS